MQRSGPEGGNAALRMRLWAWRWYWGIPLLYTLIATVMLWPLVAHVRSEVSGSAGDALLNAWAMRWVQHALVTNPLGLYEGNTFAPNHLTLAFSEALIPQALMAWPVWFVTRDALFAHNLMVLLTYPLCAVGMYALCRALGAARGAAFIAGLCYAFAPFRLDNNEHLQVLSMQWMPLTLLAIIRFVQRPTRWRGAAVTLTLALALLSSVYYLVIFGTGLAAFLAVEAIRQRRRFLSHTGIGLIGTLLATGIILIPLSLPYLQMQQQQRLTRSLDEAYDDAAHTLSYVTVLPGSLLWKHVLPTSGPEHSPLFPGLLLLVFAVVGLTRLRRPWIPGILALGLIGFILSFGPTLGAKDAGTPLPYRFFYAHVLGYQGLRGPDRFSTLPLLALCAVGSLGATRLFAWVQSRRTSFAYAGLALTALCAGGVLLEDGSHLRLTTPLDRSPMALAPYRWLASQPDAAIGTVAEFPVDPYGTRTTFYSTYHWHPVLWGTSGVPDVAYELRKRLSDQDQYVGPADLDALGDMGVRTLLVHETAYDPATFERIRSQLAKEPGQVQLVAHVGDCDIYRLLPSDEPPPTVTAAFAELTLADGRLSGQLRLHNPGGSYRVLYPAGRPAFVAEFKDAAGRTVLREEVAIPLLSLLNPGDASVPITIDAPRALGSYTVLLRAEDLPTFVEDDPNPLSVVQAGAIPHLALSGQRLTSPPLFAPDEPISLWATLANQTTVPLPDAKADADGMIDVTLAKIPPNAARIVAHGRASGLELWVAPPP